MRRPYEYEDPRASDPPLCSRFGSGAFPCGPVHKIRISWQSARPGGPKTPHRRALCEAHYVFDVTKTGVSGGASGFKLRAKNVAFQRLAAQHAADFQALYEEALRELCAETEPPIDPALLIGRAS